MSIIFPPVDLADEYGLLGVGGDLSPETLLTAYKSGIFPWPISGIKELPWFSPPNRAILYLDKFNLNKRSIRQLKNSNFELRVNTNFEEVIEQCAKTRRKKEFGESWITRDLKNAYINLYHLGYAYSIEVFLNNKLVGGLYGVKINNFFSAESMFRKENNSSKMALLGLITILNSTEVNWIDCQVITPHLSNWGAEEITRDNYLELLNSELSQPSIDFPKGVIEIFR